METQVTVYLIEGDDRVHLKIGGVEIGAFKHDTDKAAALLKFDAATRKEDDGELQHRLAREHLWP